MRSDTILRYEGMQILVNHLGKVDAEKFISLIIREPFDYTIWQRDLLSDKSIKEISDQAMKLRESK